MLINPIFTNLKALKLFGMAKALEVQLQSNTETLSFESRLGLLVDHELADRNNRRLQIRLRLAGLKQSASMEDLDYKQSRGLEQKTIMTLANCQWIKNHNNVLIVGSTGTGKTFLACALAHKACLEGFTALYTRIPKLLPKLTITKGDGSYLKCMNQMAKADVLILDDFGLTAMSNEHRRDLLELIDDRHQKKSTIVTSQLPISCWHEHIGEATLADAILDRLVHNAYKLELKGESMRKNHAQL